MPVRHLTFIALLLALVALLACTEPKPVKIGYLGGLTGRVSSLGVSGRDGVLLAVERQNRQGGLHGRRITLLVRDDQQDPDRAQQAARDLIDEGVAAIIGPMTSTMAVAIHPVINQAGIVTVSPTVKTSQLSGLEDYFFRVITPLSSSAALLAEHVAADRALRRFVVVRDDGNRAFTQDWAEHFAAELQSRGGEVAQVAVFSSGPQVSFLGLARQILTVEPEGVLLLANAMDTALVSQQLRKLGSEVPLFSAEWSSTPDLLNYGGRAVEGLTFFQSVDPDLVTPAYQEFRQEFAERFGYPPTFASVLAYDAAALVLTALDRQPDPGRLKATLQEFGSFQGVQSQFAIDRFGEVERPLFLSRVHDGRFEAREPR